MEYKTIKLSKDGRVGIITLDSPPYNAFSKRMIIEVIKALEEYEKDDQIRTVMMNSVGTKYFSMGAGAEDLEQDISDIESEFAETYSVLGGRLVEKIDTYPKSTLVAARGGCIGGSTAIFNAFDIRIVGENFTMHDGDVYYGTVGSWGMSSLRLPMWIGRNRVLDYMFLNEDFNGRQLYEMGIVSKVVADELVDEVGLAIAKKMAKAAPIAVKYYKDCVRVATQSYIEEARKFELHASDIVFGTEDCKNGLRSVMANKGVPNCEFYGR